MKKCLILLFTVFNCPLFGQKNSYFPYIIGDKYGIADIDGQLRSQNLFNEIEYLSFSKNYFSVKDDRGSYIVDDYGKNLLPNYYQSLSYESSILDGFYKKNDLSEKLKDIYKVNAQLIDGRKMTLLLKLVNNKLSIKESKDINQYYSEKGIYKYNDVNCIKFGYIPIVNNNGINLYNDNLGQLFKEDYVDVSCLSENRFSVTETSGKVNIIDSANKRFNKSEFQEYKTTSKTNHFIGIKDGVSKNIGHKSHYLLNEEGITVGGPYKELEPINGNYLVAKNDGVFIISYNGKEELYFNDGRVSKLHHGNILINNSIGATVYNKDLETIIKIPDCSLEEAFSGNYFIIKKGKNYGLIDTTGKIVLESIYEKLDYKDLGDCMISVINGKKGVFNFDLKNIIPNGFSQIETYDSYFVTTEKSRRIEYDYSGNILKDGALEDSIKIVYKEYPELHYFDKVIISDESYGSLEVLQDRYMNICIKASKKGQYNRKNSKDLFSLMGEAILPKECDLLHSKFNDKFNKEGLIEVKNQDVKAKIGLINFKGNWVFPLADQKLEIVGEMIISYTPFGTRVYNTKGKELSIQLKSVLLSDNPPYVAEYYYDQYPIDEVEKEKNRPVDDTEFFIVNDIEERVFGYVDNRGITVIKPQYTTAKAFINGFAIVGVLGGEKPKAMVIDTLGNIILSTNHDLLQRIRGEENYLLTLKKNDFEVKYGLCDLNGNELLSTEYKSIGKINDYWLTRKPSGEVSILDSVFVNIFTGENILDPYSISKVNDDFIILQTSGKSIVLHLIKKENYTIEPCLHYDIIENEKPLIKVVTGNDEFYYFRLDTQKAFK